MTTPHDERRDSTGPSRVRHASLDPARLALDTVLVGAVLGVLPLVLLFRGDQDLLLLGFAALLITGRGLLAALRCLRRRDGGRVYALAGTGLACVLLLALSGGAGFSVWATHGTHTYVDTRYHFALNYDASVLQISRDPYFAYGGLTVSLPVRGRLVARPGTCSAVTFSEKQTLPRFTLEVLAFASPAGLPRPNAAALGRWYRATGGRWSKGAVDEPQLLTLDGLPAVRLAGRVAARPRCDYLIYGGRCLYWIELWSTAGRWSQAAPLLDGMVRSFHVVS